MLDSYVFIRRGFHVPFIFFLSIDSPSTSPLLLMDVFFGGPLLIMLPNEADGSLTFGH